VFAPDVPAAWNLIVIPGRCESIEPGMTKPIFIFIIFVDAIFTTLFRRLFTNLFDVNAQNTGIACV